MFNLSEITSDTLLLTTAAGWGGSAFLFVLAIWILYRAIPDETREFMDPLGPKLKLVWPLIRVIEYYFCTNLPNEFLERIDNQLQKTGVSYLLKAEQFIALRIVCTIFSFLFVMLLLNALHKNIPLLLLASPIVGFYLPNIWLSDNRKRRTREVILAMPVYLDFLTMSVEAGLNLTGAMSQAMEKGLKGALRTEFGIVLRDVRSGLKRSDALRRMAERLDIQEVTSFVSSIIQAEKLGSSMAQVLRVQSEQRRNERFQRAEKLAMEAPVKLVFPLVVFIFPVTFIVLGFPIVIKFLSAGIL